LWRIGEEKRIEERAQGTMRIIGTKDPNPDQER
jgi:hypothetical protein